MFERSMCFPNLLQPILRESVDVVAQVTSRASAIADVVLDLKLFCGAVLELRASGL